MKSLSILMMASAVSGPALAQQITIKPLIDSRLRYEHAEQAGLPRAADAVTERVRAGAEASDGPWTALVEGVGTIALDPAYNNALNGGAGFPIVADPQTVGLNRWQLQYSGLPKANVTAGRQRINLDDQRFVGSVGWRQNEQTFDAARIEWAGVKGLKADVTYAWRDETIYGIDGRGPRPRSIGGDNVFANLSYATPVGALEGFGYLVDQNEIAVAAYQQSSQTYGGRLVGAHAFTKAAKFAYALSYARQTDYNRNPNRYGADYWLADGTLSLAALKLGAGYEILGASGGKPLTSLQTPLATLHKFQGWADKFLVTPPGGVRDVYGSLGYGLAGVGHVDAIALQAVYHRFDSDRTGLHYGEEIDLVASAKVKKYVLTATYADYSAAGFATNTKKFWLMLERAY